MKSIADYLSKIELSKIERRFSRLSLTVILVLLGANIAERYFIYSPLVSRTKARILWLHKQIQSRKGQDAADRFAISYLSARPRVSDYNTVLIETGAARPSAAKLSASLPAIMAIAGQTSAASMALIFAFLKRGEIECIVEHINRAPASSSVDWHSLLFFLTPRALSETESQAPTAVEDLQQPPCDNRLIIMDEELSPAAIRILAGKAKKVTLLQYRDLYGKIDTSAIQAMLPDCEITIEHARSRVDRFHQRYFDLHQRTFDVAETLSQNFVRNTPWLADHVPGLHGLDKDLALELSDKLFFKALRLESIYQAALDPSFDSVIVVFGNGFELYRFFYSDIKLWQDPRIKGCCWPNDIKIANKFASRISGMQRMAMVGSTAPILGYIALLKENGQTGAGQLPPEKVSRYLKSASKAPSGARSSHVPDRPAMAIVTHDGRAYGPTALQLATHLHGHYNVDVILTHGSVKNLAKAISSAQADPYLAPEAQGRQPGYLKLAAPPPSQEVTRAFSKQFNVTLHDVIKKLLWSNKNDHAVFSAIDFLLTEGLPKDVLHLLGNACAIAALFQQKKYAVIAISPIRTPRNTQFTTLARNAGLPTVTIEPHCMNASYCRYGTVPSDYAAVYSDYYAEEYNRHFGIPKNRCYSFGSPRILRPIDYDPIASRKEARSRIGLHDGDPAIIAVPTQPMPADHILDVWRMIVRAAKSLDMPLRVLLKTHPEEGPGHVNRYRQVIAEEDAGRLCFVTDVGIKDLLIASELVLTAYSVTALEAAVLERNVAIVGRPGIAYPIEYDKILGIPFCTTEQEMKDTIIEALNLGRNARSGAKDFMAENPHLFDNSSFDRLAAIIQDIINKGPEGIRRPEDLPASLFVTAPFQEYLV
ncbi:MAG: CDP-glycerol glycerophosphotransferase family protein [Sphingobium sp.]